MLKLFHYKVFRQKILMTTAGILSIAVLITIAFYSFLRSGWISLAQNRSIQLAHTIEQKLQNEDDLLMLQLVNAYASPQMIEDILQVFESRTFDGYLEARLRRSQTTDVPIRSFPEYIRTYGRRYRSALYMIVFHGDGVVHTMHFGNGEILYGFDTAFETPGIQESFSIRKNIYNPSDNYEKIGDISFFFRTSDIVSGMDFTDFTLAVLQDEDGNHYNLKNNGSLDSSLLDRVTLSQESIRFSYKMITYVDDQTMIAANFPTIAAFLIVMLILSTASILLSAYGIRYDAIFIDGIFALINAMKQGVFDPADNFAKARYQRNEYGRIARELNDMSLQLKRYIQAEYQFKIQQQQTEMRALQNQINPHFLYNTLEAISSQALLNGDKPTSDAITALGSLFREIVNLPSQISMRDEICILKTYLRVMEFKCTGNFVYHVDLAPELEEFPTIKFWLQPLAENFFSHGFDPRNSYNLLVVRGFSNGQTVCIDVMDNGRAIDGERLRAINESLTLPGGVDDSIGLRNVYNRLSLFYSGSVSLAVENGEESGIIIRIRIQKE